MVLHLAALPPELRALVATKCDAATAAQFALASRACALLLRQHLAFLLEAHRQAQRDAAARQLQQALEFALSTANLHAVNAMGGSRFAINLAAHGAQTRPSTATFTCMCCGCTQRCGHAFVNVLRHLASKTHWALHRRQVYDLDVDAAAWQAFVASVQRPASCVELYNLL